MCSYRIGWSTITRVNKPTLNGFYIIDRYAKAQVCNNLTWLQKPKTKPSELSNKGCKWGSKRKLKMAATENLIQEKLLKLLVHSFSNGKGKRRRRQRQCVLDSTEIEHWVWTKCQRLQPKKKVFFTLANRASMPKGETSSSNSDSWKIYGNY